MASSGFAGGLADGLQSSMQLSLQKKYYDGLRDYRDQQIDISERELAAKERAAAKAAKGTDFTEFDSLPLFPTTVSAPKNNMIPQAPVMMSPDFQRPKGFASGGLAMLDPKYANGGIFKNANMGGLSSLKPKGFAEGGVIGAPGTKYSGGLSGGVKRTALATSQYPDGLSGLKPRGFAEGGVVQIPDAVFSDNAPAAYQAGGLASPPPAQRQAAPVQEEEQLTNRQRIVKEMMFGNLANDPDKLDAIHAAAVMSGVGDKITPWIEGIYKAKKSGILDGAMSLLNNDIDGAIDHLKRGGMKLEDRPVKVNPDDLNDHRWKINVSGTGERIMDLKNMIGSTMDPDKFLKWQGDQQGEARQGRVADAQIVSHEANAKESLAGANLKNTQAREVKSGAKGAGKLPSDAQMVEYLVDSGVAPNRQEGWAQVKAKDGRSPTAWRESLIEANVKNGMSVAEAAKDVDAFLGQPKPAASERIPGLPEGAKVIGTSSGRPVVEYNGKRYLHTPDTPPPAAPASPKGSAKPVSQSRTPQQEQIHQARFNPMDQLRLRELHHEVTASNLTGEQRAQLEAEIQAIAARNG